MSVCLTHAGIVSKRLYLGSSKKTSYDSRVTSFLTAKISAKFGRGHPKQRRHMQVGWIKISDFTQITRYHMTIESSIGYEIDAQFLLQSNRKSYLLYRVVILPISLGTPKLPNHPNLCILHRLFIFLVVERRGFTLGTQVDRIRTCCKFQPWRTNRPWISNLAWLRQERRWSMIWYKFGGLPFSNSAVYEAQLYAASVDQHSGWYNYVCQGAALLGTASISFATIR